MRQFDQFFTTQDVGAEWSKQTIQSRLDLSRKFASKTSLLLICLPVYVLTLCVFLTDKANAVKAVIGSDVREENFLNLNPKETELASPKGITQLDDGSLLITDCENNRVLRMTVSGEMELYAGTGEKGNGLDLDPKKTKLTWPADVTQLVDGSVLITDSGNRRVLRVTRDGEMLPYAGNGKHRRLDESPKRDPTNTPISKPTGVTQLADRSVLITDADVNNARVWRVTPDREAIEIFAGRSGTSSAKSVNPDPTKTELVNPTDVAQLADGNVLITDAGHNRVLQVSIDGTMELYAGIDGDNGSDHLDPDPTKTGLAWPGGVTQLADGGVLILDSGNNRVLKVASNGKMELYAGRKSEHDDHHLDRDPLETLLSGPVGATQLNDGSVLITENFNNRVLCVSEGEAGRLEDKFNALVEAGKSATREGNETKLEVIRGELRTYADTTSKLMRLKELELPDFAVGTIAMFMFERDVSELYDSYKFSSSLTSILLANAALHELRDLKVKRHGKFAIEIADVSDNMQEKHWKPFSSPVPHPRIRQNKTNDDTPTNINLNPTESENLRKLRAERNARMSAKK